MWKNSRNIGFIIRTLRQTLPLFVFLLLLFFKINSLWPSDTIKHHESMLTYCQLNPRDTFYGNFIWNLKRNSLKKMDLKDSSAKCEPFCSCCNILHELVAKGHCHLFLAPIIRDEFQRRSPIRLGALFPSRELCQSTPPNKARDRIEWDHHRAGIQIHNNLNFVDGIRFHVIKFPSLCVQFA